MSGFSLYLRLSRNTGSFGVLWRGSSQRALIDTSPSKDTRLLSFSFAHNVVEMKRRLNGQQIGLVFACRKRYRQAEWETVWATDWGRRIKISRTFHISSKICVYWYGKEWESGKPVNKVKHRARSFSFCSLHRSTEAEYKESIRWTSWITTCHLLVFCC